MWLFIVCGLIAYTAKPVSASCPAELSPPSVVVRFGDSFSANCTSSSNQTESMGWESAFGGVDLQPGASLVILKIDPVTAWSIEPFCFMNLLNQQQCEKKLPVIVYKTPKSVSMSQPLVDMIEGRQYAIQCDVVDVAPAKSLLVHWYKGNTIFYTETFKEPSSSPVNQSSVLNLTAHRDDNGAQIWCKAKLDLWPSGPNPTTMQSKSHPLTVLYPPVFAMPANEMHELEGRKKITLNCTAVGNPMPIYKWQFPQNMQEAINGNQAVMTLSSPPPGNYSCIASNKHGRNVKSFIITEAPRDQTTLAAILGGGLSVAVLLVVVGVVTVQPDGMFSCNKGSYIRGQPTSSGPV